MQRAEHKHSPLFFEDADGVEGDLARDDDEAAAAAAAACLIATAEGMGETYTEGRQVNEDDVGPTFVWYRAR